MIPSNKTVEIYYLVDEFLKEYDAVKSKVIPWKRVPQRKRKGGTANSQCPVAR